MPEIIVDPLPPLVDLNGSQAIVDDAGRASAYFLRYLFDRNGNITQVDQLIQEFLAAVNGLQVQAGGALTVTPNPGLIVDSPTISLDALSPDPSGTFTNADITVDEYGRVTAASTGGSGGSSYYETVITSGGASNVQFASISQSYTNMTIKIRGQAAAGGTGTQNVLLRINGDTSGNHNWNQRLMLNTGVTNSFGGGVTSQQIGVLPQSTNAYQRGEIICWINDYTDTATNKSLVSHGSGYSTGTLVFDTGGLFNVVGAVSQIDIFLNSGNFTDGTMVQLILDP